MVVSVNGMMVDHSASSQTPEPAPMPEAQRDLIVEAMKVQMKQGQAWYVLCSKWWQLWRAYVRYEEKADADGGDAKPPTPATPQAGDGASAAPLPSPEADGVMVTKMAVEGANEHGVAELSLEEGAAVQGGPGPIDNRDLGEGRDLREGMMEVEDYVLLNNRAYELLESWYGGGPRFQRWVVSLGNDSHTELSVELFPVKFMVYTCLPNGEADKASVQVQLFSRAKTMRQVFADVKSHLGLSPRIDTRLSLRKLDADQDETGDAAAAAEVLGSTEGAEEDGWQTIHLEEVSQGLHEVMGDTQTVALLVETKDTSDPNVTTFPRDHILLRWRFNLTVGDLIDARDSDKNWFESRVTEVDVDEDPQKIRVHFMGWSEKWDQVFERTSQDVQKLHTFTTHWRQDLQVNSKLEVSVRSDGTKRWYDGTVEEIKYEGGKRLLKVSAANEASPPQWLPEDSEEICKVSTHINKPSYRGTLSRARSGSAGSYGFYRSNIKGKPLVRGAVGLSNLGNTCFMNSMLQCLLATESFSAYFRSLHWKQEINQDNPLGMGGKVAEAYAGLNDEAWSGEYSVVVPNTLKKVVSQYAPMFAGHQQHDASELMSFLLDGIHEDLNRVHKKPYLETVDSAGRADAVVAEESWRRYLMRNDSIMVDTCTGLLRSHVTCPKCSHSSVTFDPYTSLSLPLPVESAVMVQAVFHPLPYGTRPMKVAFTLEKDSTIRALKTIICQRFNADRAKDGSAHSKRGLLTEDCLAVFEVWCSRVCKGLEDSCPLSVMKSTDSYSVAEMEFPLAEENEEAKGNAGKNRSVPAAGEGSSPANGGAATKTGEAASSGRGQSSSQATSESEAEGARGGESAAGTAGAVDGGKTGSANILIDLVLATRGSSPLTGAPRRITCRSGVTNNELHRIIRRHVSRFVPSLSAAAPIPPSSMNGTPSRSPPGKESAGARAMAVDGHATQEAGISSTSDIDSDYVHVTDTMALDAGAGGHLSPFVHVKKAPAVVPDGGSPSSSAADMDIEADEEVWSESAAPPPSAASVSVMGGGGATGAGVRAKSGTTAAAGSPGARGLDGEGRPLGEGKGQKERLPYNVLVTDYAGTASKGARQEVPMNDEAFEGDKPEGYTTAARSGRNDHTTLKIQFRQESGRASYDLHSLIDEEEMEAVDTHESSKEAQREHQQRQSVPINRCFDKFTEFEQLGTSELWYCAKCKAHRQAFKKLDVYTAPDVLIVVLKRFLFSPGSSMVYRQKLDTHVSFPVTGLDLTRNIQAAGGPILEGAPPIYDLYAVSEHSGSLRAGHYTAIAQNPEDKTWYSFNDSHVSPTEPDQSPSSMPYVLFYKRRQGSLRWAGMGRNHAS